MSRKYTAYVYFFKDVNFVNPSFILFLASLMFSIRKSHSKILLYYICFKYNIYIRKCKQPIVRIYVKPLHMYRNGYCVAWNNSYPLAIFCLFSAFLIVRLLLVISDRPISNPYSSSVSLYDKYNYCMESTSCI